MKFNWKNKRFISSLATVVLIGLGVVKPELIGGIIGDSVCAEVQCDA